MWAVVILVMLVAVAPAVSVAVEGEEMVGRTGSEEMAEVGLVVDCQVAIRDAAAAVWAGSLEDKVAATVDVAVATTAAAQTAAD